MSTRNSNTLFVALCVILITVMSTASYLQTCHAADDAVQTAAKAGDAAAVQRAISSDYDKLTPEAALANLDKLRRIATFPSTLADHLTLDKSVMVLRNALQELDALRKENTDLKAKYEPKPAEKVPAEEKPKAEASE